jgi:hypothetical protein
MQGRRRQKRGSVEFFKESEKELERIELLWSIGIVKMRDERQYYYEVEPYYSDIDFRINTLRIIR